MVAYKGGHVDKDLFHKVNIPCLNLETWGCLKYEQLKQRIVEPLEICGFHLNDNIHHMETRLMKSFLNRQRGEKLAVISAYPF